jgi:hypothetical protein
VRCKVQLGGGLLLKSRRRKWRQGIALLGADLDIGDGKLDPFQLGDDIIGRLLIRKLRLFAVYFRQLGSEGASVLLGQQNLDFPVLLRNKGPDQFFALADQAQSHRLHPPGGQPPGDGLP